MNGRQAGGRQRSTVAVPPGPDTQDCPYTPVRVLDLDLDDPDGLHSPASAGPVDPRGRVLVLARLHGHPLGVLTVTSPPGDPGYARRALARAVCRELSGAVAAHRAADARALAAREPAVGRPVHSRLPGGDAAAAHPCRLSRSLVLRDPPAISVVVATHNRVRALRQCLDSLLRTGYPRLEVLVVDNAPQDDEARAMVQGRYRGRIRYLREPVAGLARAHNRALTEVTGAITAFTDDDTLVDPDWPAAIAETFAASDRIGCVTGLILPAELETRAQADLQRHGGYDKGFTMRTWSLADPPGDPLFPFTAGRFGSGANMAFRTGLLHTMGGFDPATGTGTAARGGDDLLGFFRALVAGATLAYQPDAVVWHRPSQDPDALPAQAFGYGAGFGAFLAAAVAHEPAMLPALARRLPRGVHYAATRRRDATAQHDGWSRRLSLLEVQGLLYGPLGYLRASRSARRLGAGG
ncbi:glycosyltransferase family 2 protein [Streptacidiphilus sp. N1-10]|uniref:Glycosyltransferase family 2 protein n=1 Tax=Streptacidiphilus jeojiensis TaxID=3229225 RepID=A0ABV6XKE7_9ACTN